MQNILIIKKERRRHELKQLRENQFKIENINNIKNNENVEEHVEKYFDKI